MTGMRYITDPAMFERFHAALTSERAGYTPWYFLLSKGLKDPMAGISWKQLEGRLTFAQALTQMRAGHNIGIAATGMDALCIVDVDDIEATPDEIVKPTLSTRSRKRIGRHYFYFTDDPRCKENLPTEEKGEIRSSFEYVVAPGSFVLCNDKTIAAMPEAERERAGRYTVENERAPDTIVFEELPPVFLEQAQKNREAEKATKKRREEKAQARKDNKPARGDDKNKSVMWDLSINDVVSIPNKARFKSLFHESETGKNTAINDDGGLTCWRHLVTHTPMSALAVMAGVADCNSAGQGFNRGKSSSIDYSDGMTLFKMWLFAKREGMIPKDDPIPAEVIRWYAVDNKKCKPDEIIDGWKLPGNVYRQTLGLIEDREKLSTGRRIVKRNITTAHTEISPDTFLIGDKEAFDANGFSKWLLNGSGFTFATLPGDDDMMWYREGVYIRGGDIEIKKVIEEIMDGFKVTTHAVNEVIGHVQRRTYTESDEFDKDKHIINLKNGLYNTETSELIPHTPEYLSTVQIPVEHDGDATCPVIDQFLTDVLDDEDIGAAMEWFGYLLEPHYWIQKMLMLLGEGSNGKSKFLGLLSAFIGKKNISNESIQDLSNNRFRVANLHGKLANIHADISSRALHDTGILKLLSGGDDVSVEKKNKSSFEFENFARMVFSANRLPHAEDDTDAWYRRWTFINFTRKFGDDPDAVSKADKKILEKITVDSELSGLLNRALDALKGLHDRDGFRDNMSTEDTRAIYRRLSDPVATFIEDCCILGSDVKVGRAALFRAYVNYCDVNRQAVLGQAAFVRRIKDMGVFSDCQVGTKGKQERGFRGVNIDGSIMDTMNKTTLNNDEIIIKGSGNTLGNTLRKNEKPLTVDFGNTLNTGEKTILGSGRKKGVKYKSGAQDAKLSVLSVLPEPTDSDNGVCQSVLPSVLPDSMEGISHGTKAMLFIAECHKRYNIETDHAFNVISAKLEDQGYDQKLINHCVTRYRQGHRVHTPMPGCETP